MTTSSWPPSWCDRSLAVLVSGGLDSSVLLGEAVRHFRKVHPIVIRAGSVWESEEHQHLKQFIAAIECPPLQPLVELSIPVADLYGEHWSLSGRNVPDEHSEDAAVFLPGRNVVLLSKSLIWCHLNGVPEIATAPLKGNPFADATPEFYASFAKVVNMAFGGCVEILRPYADLSKGEVVGRGREMPLEYTFSCIRPIEKRHCGRCNKCAERQQAFRGAEVLDPTLYATD